MPTVICSYCQYVGQGSDQYAKWNDAKAHELVCPYNPDNAGRT